MKKTLSILLIAALLVLAVPASVLAAPAHTFTAQLNIVAVGGTEPVVDYDNGIIKYTVYYAGVVTDSTRKDKEWEKFEGAIAVAQEEVAYDLIQYVYYGNLVGTGNGTVTISGKNKDSAVFSFQSIISGNIYAAGDIGNWTVTETKGSYSVLKDATVDWAASVHLEPTGYPPPNDYTFVGTATAIGTY